MPNKDLIIKKGLSAVTSRDNPDYQIWAERYKEELKDYTTQEIKQIYKNSLFEKEFGREKFLKTNIEDRDGILENHLVNNYIEDNYSEDERFDEINNLTLEGKRELINSGYLDSSTLKSRIEGASKKAEELKSFDEEHPILTGLRDISANRHGTYSATKKDELSAETEVESTIQNQEFTLNNIIEKDKERKVNNVSNLDYAINRDYHAKLNSGELTLGDIYDEFDKIGSGYAETNTINGKAYWQEIPGSNYYNVFKDTKWLNNLSKEDKIDIMSKYKALANTYGLQDALYYLDTTIKEKVADEQSGWRAAGDTIKRVAWTGVVPGLVEGALGLYAMTLNDEEAALFLEGKDKNGNPIEGWGNIKYISDVQKYNTYDKALISEANENGGISQTNTVWTVEQDNAWLSNKTFADVAEQSKWMIEMIAMGALTSGIGAGLIRVGSTIGKIGKIASATGKVAKIIDTTADATKGLGNLTKLAIDVAPISAAEAYETYLSTYENTLSIINNEIDKKAQERAYEELSGELEEVNKSLALSNIESIMQEDIENFKRQYPDIDVSTINEDHFREQAAQKYLSYLTEQHKQEISNEYSKEKEVASNMAVDAYKTTFVMSTIKSAISNVGFRRFMYDASFRLAFKGSVPKVNTRINSKGLVEQIPMTTWQKYVEPVYRNTLGEAIDEGLDGIISGFGEGYGTGKFQHYWDNRNNTDSFDRWLGGVLSGFSAVGDKLTDESLYKEMLIGGIGGITNMSPSSNLFTVDKTPPINGKSYTFLERFNNIITNQLINDILENKRAEAETAQRVENINKILSKFSDTYSSIGKIMTSLGAHDRAIMTGTPEEILNTRQEAAVDLMMALEALSKDGMSSSSTIVETTKKAIEEAAKGNITEADINEFLSQPTNKDLRDKMSVEDIKSRIQENAKKLLSTEEQIVSTRKSLDKYPGFSKQPKEVQDFLIKNSIAIEGFKERMSSISEELGLNSSSYTPVIGSSKHLADKKRAIEEAIKEVDEKIEETEELTKKNFKEALEANNPNKVFSKRSKKLALKELKKSKKKLKRELDVLNSIQINEDGYSRTLSAEEILALDFRSLSEILNKENEKYYSDAQKVEIDKARESLNEKIKNSSLDLTVPMGFEDYAEYYAYTLSSLNTNVEIGTRSLDMFLEEGFNATPAESLWKQGIGDSRRFLDKASMLNSWDEILFTTDGKLVDDIDDSKLDDFITNPFTGALEDYVDDLRTDHPNYKGNVINKLKTVLIKSRVWNQVSNSIARSESKSKKFNLVFLYTLIKNNDFNNSDEFVDILQNIINSEAVSQEHKNLVQKFISIITGVEKLDDSTVVSDTPIEEKKEDTTTEPELEPSAETLVGLEDIEDSDDDTETNEDTTVEQEEVKEDIAGPVLESPISDSTLPTDEGTSTVDRGELQGNRVYKYDGESLRENKKQVVRTPEKEGDIHDLINKWLSNRGIKLQETIDNELASIARLNPKVFFVMPNTTEFDSDGSPVYNKDTNPFLNTIFQVVEYTDEIKKIHNEEYGKPIFIGNKPYLIIGVSGYNSNNKAEMDAYNRIADSTKRVRYATTKRIKSEGKRIPEFVINPTIHTEIKEIQAGWVVKQTTKDDEVKDRAITELIEDKERNPHGITLQNSKWLIQEKSKIVTVRVDKSDVVHSPSDVESNLGSVFLLVPAANGHLVPISFKVRMLKDLKEGSTLRTAITEEILKLTRMDNREDGLSNLLDLLLLSKDGDSIFFDTDALEDNILVVKRKGLVIKEINLGANDVTTQLDDLFFGESSTFKLNINVRVLSDPTQLRIYSESGALYTDAALLGTSNASYTIRALDENYKPIQDPESTVNSSSSGFKGDYTDSQSKVMTYMGHRYTEKDGEFYDNNGSLVTSQSRKQELIYAKWVEETNPTPSHENASVKVYIKDGNENNPIVIRQYSSGRVSILSKENALREINRKKEEELKRKREEEAKKALERVEQTSTTVEEESKTTEETTSIDDLFAEIEQSLPKENTTEIVEEVETPKTTTDNSVLSEGVPAEDLNSTSDVVTYLFSGQAEGESIEALEDLLIDKGLETEEDVRKYLDRNNISIVGIKSEDIGSLLEIIRHCKE